MLSPYPDARPSAQDLMHNTTIAQYLKLQFACLKLSTPTQKLLSYTNIAHDLKSMAEENEASTYNPHGIHRDSRAVSPATVHSLETRSIALASDDASSPAQDASLQQLATPSIDTVEQGVNTLWIWNCTKGNSHSIFLRSRIRNLGLTNYPILRIIADFRK